MRRHAHITHAEHGIRRLGFVLHHLQLHRTAHHHVGQLLLVGIGGIDSTYIFALTQNSDTIRHLHDLVELMGDKEDGFTLLTEVFHNGHQLVDLLGCQNGSGFIKNQNLIIAVEHLQDFHTLLHTHGNVLHFGIHIHLQAVALR